MKIQNQMRWVILLLVIAVVLPTVCLLWFMTAAVKNERLAVRQKLVDTYKQQLDEIANECNHSYRGLSESLVREIKRNEPEQPPARFERNMASMGSDDPNFIGYRLMIYDSNGQIEFPRLTVSKTNLDFDELEAVWQIEFVKK